MLRNNQKLLSCQNFWLLSSSNFFYPDKWTWFLPSRCRSKVLSEMFSNWKIFGNLVVFSQNRQLFLFVLNHFSLRIQASHLLMACMHSWQSQLTKICGWGLQLWKTVALVHSVAILVVRKSQNLLLCHYPWHVAIFKIKIYENYWNHLFRQKLNQARFFGVRLDLKIIGHCCWENNRFGPSLPKTLSILDYRNLRTHISR